ncbi:MAG: SAF domain-containing protein [Actinomycetota bacterium]
MNNRRYLILAVLGALIIGVSCYLFLNSFMDRVAILVFSRDIEEGEVIGADDLHMKQYYKNGLPDSYMTDKSEAVGKKIFMDRNKDDFISKKMLLEEEDRKVSYNLRKDEVLIAINVKAVEPVLEQLKAGEKISIVSTVKDTSIIKASTRIHPESENTETIIAPGKYIDRNTFNLSKNILYIDGYIMIRNLEVLDLEKIASPDQNILAAREDKESVNIYLKCGIPEAPYISALASNEKFKIILEGAG